MSTRAIDRTRHCSSMAQVRQHIDALDDVLVPLLVERGGYMTQAARIKTEAAQVRDEARIEQIVQRVRARAAAEGGEPQVIEAIYRAMMEAYIAFEHREFARLVAEGHKQPQEESAP
ncbi:chorismate mutase [Melaminivora alkalimesophila]|uniref:chorismate mutase n=1 Tax=Melaminivora alkalimesophila TaxID=1165852 RepID=A0A317RE14_9BURK|nr:chorismate mutase [Melaminivora alkalimesophila]PWW45581.1 isochorismate pyruvate lyase [Melaminivora alkalimesophila]